MKLNTNSKRLLIFAGAIAVLMIFSTMSATAAPTAVIQCDSTTDWTGYSATLSVDNTEWKEWDGSLKVDGGSSGSQSVAAYNPTGSWDFSNDDYIVFWLKDSSSNTLTFAIEESDTDEVQYTFTSSSGWRTYVLDISGHKTTPDDPAGDGTFDWTDVNRFWIGSKSIDTTFWIDYITIGDANDLNQWQMNKYEFLVRNIDKNGGDGVFYYDVWSDQNTYDGALVHGINNANSGETVEVGKGTYARQYIINSPGITVTAVQDHTAIIQPTSIAGWPNMGAVDIQADDVTFDGFEIDGSLIPVNHQVINIYGASGVTISNNIVHGATSGTWDGMGIAAWDWDGSKTVDDITIIDNVVYDTGRMGIFCMDYDNGAGKYDLTTGHVITGNTVYDAWLKGDTWGDAGGAIQINVGADCTISDNLIYNTATSTFGTHYNAGIYFDGSASGNVISNNIVRDNPTGVTTWINPSFSIDWEGETPTTPVVTQNNIYNNANFGAYNTGSITLDAECNYWGDPSGPYHSSNSLAVGDTVSNKVDYNPWLTGAAPGGACDGGICYDTVFVDDDFDSSTPGWNIDHFATIQDGIDRVCDCGTVNVNNGVYVEQVHIRNKNIKLIGENKHNTIIQLPSSGVKDVKVGESSQLYEYVVGIWGYDYYNSGNDTIWGPSTITVEMTGFSIDANDYNPSDRFSAILMRNVNNDNCGKADIHHNKIYNVHVDGKETFGILGYGDMHVRIRGNRIDQFSRGGIGIYSGYADVKNNRVIGPYDGGTPITWAPNGIQLGYGAEGRIRKNNVEKCGWPGSSWAGTGIMVVDTSNVIIEDNYVHDCEQAMAIVEYFGTPCTNIDIIGNNIIEYCEWGLSIANGVDDVLVENNIFRHIVGDAIDVYNYSWNSNVPTNIDIHFNQITDAGYDGLWVGSHVTQTVNATCNWWGSPNGPVNPTNHFNVGAQGTSVVGNAKYIGWLYAPGDTTCFAPIYNLDTGEGFACIQEAIDDADTDDGDVIECTDGTYTHGGNIQVTKGVTIQGGSKPIVDGAGGRYAFEILSDDVTLKNLKITNSNPTGPSNNGGVLVRGYDNFLIRGCVIYDISSSLDDYGLFFYGADNSEAKWNNIYNIDDYGVAFGNDNTNVLVHKCTIRACGDTGVYIWNSPLDGVEVHNCSIFGHTNYGMQNLNTGYEFPACCNYWGADNGPGPVGPGSGDHITDHIIYAPWLDEKHWDDPSCFSPVYNWDQDKWYVNIQDAIDDANPGDRIGANGTFNENVLIDVDGITLEPLDPMPSFGWTGVWGPPAVIDGAGGRFAIEIVADDVTVQGFNIINTNPSGGPTVGSILARGVTGALIQDNIIDLGATTTGTDLAGINFWGTDDSTIMNNNIVGCDEYGILLGNGNDDITIEYNDIISNGIGVYGRDYVLSNIQIHYNDIVGNNLYGVKNDYTGYDIDATCNWWGDADGPSGVGPGSGDAVTDNVIYDPWTGSLTVTATAPGSPTVWCVDPDVEFDGTVTPACTYASPTYTVEWDFGDGASMTGNEDPTHTYERGCYTAEFTATVLVHGDTATYSDTVDVWVKNSAPVIDDAYWDGPSWQQNLWNDRPVLYLTTFVVPITDCDGDLFDYSITTSPDIGSVSVAGDSDGEKSIVFSGLAWDTTYTITVEVDDEYTTCPGKPDTGENSRTFTFTTADCPDPAYVDDDFKTSTTGFGVDKFMSLQEGVDWVCEDGTVIVKEGIYGGATISKTLTLTGEILPGEEAAVLEDQLFINADDVTVNNLVFNPSSNGAVVVDASGATVEHNKFLKDCVSDAVGISANGYQVDALYNYWGAMDGPSSGADPITGHVADGFGVKILGDVHFDPFAGLNAKAMADKVEIEAGQVVQFDAYDSFAYRLDGTQNTIAEYRWDFDDGSALSYNGATTHVFNSVGTYEVSLRVSAVDSNLHNNFMFDWDEIVIIVTDSQTPLGANADGESLGGYEGHVGEPIQLYGEAIGGEGQYIYHWDFGDDKATTNKQNPLHVYDEPGTYTATLTVYSGQESSSDTAEVTVYEIEELIVSLSDKTTVIGSETSFTAKVSGGEAPYTYEWDFGDGSSSTEQNPSHTYATSGDYTVTLTVEDNNGDTKSTTATTHVEEGETNIEPLEIKDVSGGFGVSAMIIAGNSNVDWSITVDGTVFFGGENSGSIDANVQEKVRVPFSLGFGQVQITITANSLTKTYEAFMLGPFYLNVQQA